MKKKTSKKPTKCSEFSGVFQSVGPPAYKMFSWMTFIHPGITLVTGHLASKQTHHQRTRHQGTISPPTYSPPSEVFSPPTTNKEIN